MKLAVRLISVLLLFLLASPVILLKGCSTLDQENGCPDIHRFYDKCINYANDGDTITGPDDGTLELGAGYSGGTVYYVPLHYVLRDSTGAPRNNVCVDFWTDGYFYADINYTMYAPYSGLGNYMTLKTDDRGVICVYWSTEYLPPSPGSGSDDATGQTFVEATSGTAFHRFNIDWTVKALQ